MDKRRHGFGLDGGLLVVLIMALTAASAALDVRAVLNALPALQPRVAIARALPRRPLDPPPVASAAHRQSAGAEIVAQLAH